MTDSDDEWLPSMEEKQRKVCFPLLAPEVFFFLLRLLLMLSTLVLPVFLLPRRLGVCRGCVRGGGRCHRPQALCFVGGSDATRLFFSVDKARIHQARRTQLASALQWPLPRVWFVLLVPCLRLRPCIGVGDHNLVASVGLPVLDGRQQGRKRDSEGPVLRVSVLVFIPHDCEIAVKPVVKKLSRASGGDAVLQQPWDSHPQCQNTFPSCSPPAPFR